MPSSRNDHLLIVLGRLPWWVTIAAAVIVFVALRWVAPTLAGSRPILSALGHAASANAWWVAALFLLPLPVALFNAGRRRRLVDAQASIDDVRALSWQDFEHLVAEAYGRYGYHVRARGGARADGGIDLELRSKDKMIVVQCKHWKARTVGVVPVRELYGAMAAAEAHSAIFVTSGRYTPDAIEFARDKPIKLVDGQGLMVLLKSAQVADRSSPRVVEENPAEVPVITTANGPITCPRCGGAMVKRVAKQGVNAGEIFWGCSQFPACRGARAA